MSHARSTARHILMFAGIVALGLASVAQAQPVSADPAAVPKPPAAAPASQDPLGEVTVDGARRDPLRNMDPKKRAEFDAEVAKQDAARHYRGSTPKPAADNKGISDPNDLSQDYPGLRTYVPAN